MTTDKVTDRATVQAADALVEERLLAARDAIDKHPLGKGSRTLRKVRGHVRSALHELDVFEVECTLLTCDASFVPEDDEADLPEGWARSASGEPFCPAHAAYAREGGSS